MKILNILKSKSKGFTLIELLVVIAIIGILAAVVLVSLNTARAKSRDAKRLADGRQIMTGLELYFNDNNAYPSAASNHPDPTSGATGSKWSNFMSLYPAYPTPANDGGCLDTDYVYVSVTPFSTYTLDWCIGAPTGGFTNTSGAATIDCTASPAGLSCV